jgi:uncharacterized membrane-anchored protein
MINKNNLLLVTSLILSVNLHAQEEPEVMSDEEWETYTSELEAGLSWQSGDVYIDNDRIHLNLGENYQYVGPEDAEVILSQLWGNPPGATTLGMIFPADCRPSAPSCWGGILEIENDGHIDDEDAAEIDYDDLLEEMQDNTKESNESRSEMGYGTVDLIGWASKPYYNQASKKLHWAKELSFSDSPSNTLNYNIRVLGRVSVLNTNLVSGIEQKLNIVEALPEITDLAEFTEGNTYADFDPTTNNLATYGIGALIGGKMIAKVGFFKGILLALLAGKKFVIIGVIALWALLKKVMSRKEKEVFIEEETESK